MSNFAPNLSTGPCLYCNDMAKEGPEEMLRCELCRQTAHITCLKSGIPEGRLLGDNFFSFTCSPCQQSDLDSSVRAKLNTPQLLLLVLYNLHKTDPNGGRQGFFHWKIHIYNFINQHWKEIFGPERYKKKKKTLQASLSGQLSHYGQYFVSGYETLQDGGWYKLSMVLPPAQLIHQYTTEKAKGTAPKIVVKEENMEVSYIKEEVVEAVPFAPGDMSFENNSHDESSQGSWFMEKDVLKPRSQPPLSLFDSEEEVDEGSVVKKEGDSEMVKEEVDFEFVNIDEVDERADDIKSENIPSATKSSLFTANAATDDSAAASVSSNMTSGDQMNTQSFYGSKEFSSSSSDDDDSTFDETYEVALSDCDNNDVSISSELEEESEVVNEESEEVNMSAPLNDVRDSQKQPSGTKETAWQDVVALARNFGCTANEQIQYNLSASSEGDIQPIDVYRIFINDDVIDLMVRETNRMFDVTAAEKQITRKSKMKAWSSATAEDIKKFLGILILMGLNNQPTFECYWSKSKIYGVELIKRTMPRNKFELLLRFLHFADNSLSDGSDRLFKLRPLIQLLSLNFQKFTPGEKVVIDESMVLFRGRTILRQYNPQKSHKYGIRVYKLCTVDGYTWKFMIYRDKGDTALGLPHAEYITMALMEGLLREGRTLYIDNFYSSVPLARHLLEKSTYVCGTLRSNRKHVPKSVTGKKLKKGEVTGKQNSEGIKVMKWKDKRDVLMLTSVPEHITEKVGTGQIKHGKETEKPQCILDYNAAKKRVDYSDQMSSYYSPLRKIRKWYKKAAFELILGTAVVNSFILYNKYHTRKAVSMKEFRESLVLSLLTGKSTENIKIGKESTPITGKRLPHVLIELEGQCRAVRKRCRGCYEVLSQNEGSAVAASKARRVKTICGQCEGKPHLCPSCFERKHSDVY